MLETNSVVRLMKKLLGIVVLSLLLSGNAYANYLAKGTFECGEVLSKENDYAKDQLKAYLNGYITGRNYETNMYVGKGVSADSLYYALLKYCKENPLMETHDAAENVYIKLQFK